MLDPDRAGPAVAVVVDGTPYLVDMGAGVIRRLAAARRGGRAGVIGPLFHGFVTHLHSDHTVGYPDFLLSPWAVGRRGPVTVAGPPGLQAMTDAILSAYREDIAVRGGGGPALAVQETTGGVVHEDAKVRVTAFEVTHPPWQHALGFVFETADRKIVISGDTSPSDALVEHARGCDVLVHEVYSRAWITRAAAAGGDGYHRSAHTSSDELGQLATRIQPGILVLYHQLFATTSPSELEDEVRAHYTGTVISANDLDSF